MDGISLVTFILPRGRGETLLRLCAEENIRFRLLLRGRGTASSEILSLLGTGPDRDVVLLSVEKPRVEELIRHLGHAIGADKPGGGVAFSIPLSAMVSYRSSYELMAGTLPREETKKGRLRGRRKAE
ncbi:MAG: hypothetical protein IKQ36_08720 [Clostridia bacterium]|nr:hypothetical protein [Clostridia bacterium]